MKRKRAVIGVTLLLIFILLAATLFGKHVQENEAIKENEELHRQYKQASSHMYMELDESVYEQTGNPEDLVLSPTEMTFDLLNRWKFISENYQEINYPEELINQGDWVQVRKTLGEQSLTMEDVSIKIGEEYEDNPDKKIQCLCTTIFIIMIVPKITFKSFLKITEWNKKEVTILHKINGKGSNCTSIDMVLFFIFFRHFDVFYYSEVSLSVSF